MANLPYITAPGNIEKAFNGIKSATMPDRVTQDFVKTILKIPGGSGDQMTTFIKKLKFTNQDGSPNERYRKFRNPKMSAEILAEAIKDAYRPLFIRNEFANELSEDKLLGLIVEETGNSHDSSNVKMTLKSFLNLKKMANFTKSDELDINAELAPDQGLKPKVSNNSVSDSNNSKARENIGLNLGYTINLNLPATSDPAVFDAIFKSLKANLLSNDDA